MWGAAGTQKTEKISKLASLVGEGEKCLAPTRYTRRRGGPEAQQEGKNPATFSLKALGTPQPPPTHPPPRGTDALSTHPTALTGLWKSRSVRSPVGEAQRGVGGRWEWGGGVLGTTPGDKPMNVVGGKGQIQSKDRRPELFLEGEPHPD